MAGAIVRSFSLWPEMFGLFPESNQEGPFLVPGLPHIEDGL
jgi:hypothetical protein